MAHEHHHPNLIRSAISPSDVVEITRLVEDVEGGSMTFVAYVFNETTGEWEVRRFSDAGTVIVKIENDSWVVV